MSEREGLYRRIVGQSYVGSKYLISAVAGSGCSTSQDIRVHPATFTGHFLTTGQQIRDVQFSPILAAERIPHEFMSGCQRAWR